MTPPVTGILETALYVDDLPRAAGFYQIILGLETLSSDERMCALSVADRQLLLLFKRGASTQPMPFPGGVIPPHDASGPIHFAFSVEAGELARWERHLATHGVPIESRVNWSRGGSSIYFRDPDGHLVELATPGVWSIY
jgi:catechol-2,3-dioxygenase